MDLSVEVYSANGNQDESCAQRVLDNISATTEERMPKVKRFELEIHDSYEYYEFED